MLAPLIVDVGHRSERSVAVMKREEAETVRTVDELWHAETPATVRSVANSLEIEDEEAKQRLQELVDSDTAVKAPIKITVLVDGGTTGVTDAYFLRVPDAVFNAEDALGAWRREA